MEIQLHDAINLMGTHKFLAEHKLYSNQIFDTKNGCLKFVNNIKVLENFEHEIFTE